MRAAAFISFVLCAATVSAADDTGLVVSEEPLHGLSMEARPYPASSETSALGNLAPAAGYDQVRAAVDKCADDTAQALRISRKTAHQRCLQRLLGP